VKAFPALIAAAAVALGVVAWRSKDPHYVAPARAAMPTSVPVTLTGDVPDGSVVRTFEVTGMGCDGCAGKLYDAVTRIEGVGDVAVYPILGRAEVVVAHDVDPATVAAALTFDKYTAAPAE